MEIVARNPQKEAIAVSLVFNGGSTSALLEARQSLDFITVAGQNPPDVRLLIGIEFISSFLVASDCPGNFRFGPLTCASYASTALGPYEFATTAGPIDNT
jgi:hypothetical protein